jgi:cysteine rich repeat protein
VTHSTKLLAAGVCLLVGVAVLFGFLGYWQGREAQGWQSTSQAQRQDAASELSWAPAARKPSTAPGFAALFTSACGKEDRLLCQDVEPGGGRVMQCLTGLQANVSDSCRSFLQRVRADRNGAGEPPRIVAACGQEMQKFCNDVQPGAGRKARCLLEHRTEVSHECSAYLQQIPAARQTSGSAGNAESGPSGARSKFALACRQDMQTFCAGVKPGEGRVVQCLRERQSDISGECKSSLQAFDVPRQAQ